MRWNHGRAFGDGEEEHLVMGRRAFGDGRRAFGDGEESIW